MATYVLVHGAWHGGWCWRNVTPLLRAGGHEVYSPTLTGLGERVHLLSPEVGLDTHIKDVVNVLEFEELTEVVLVGHSYGGMVITGVAEQAAARLAHLVYLDAFIPWDGQPLFALLGPERETAMRDQADREGDGWRIPPIPLESFGVADPADLAWAGPRIGMQPLRTFAQPVPLGDPHAASLPRTFIRCTRWPGFARYEEHARGNGWRMHALDAGHDAMITHPREVAGHLGGTA